MTRPLHWRLYLLEAATVLWSTSCSPGFCLHAMSGAATARESTSVRSRLERNQAGKGRIGGSFEGALRLVFSLGGGAPLRAASGCKTDGRRLGAILTWARGGFV